MISCAGVLALLTDLLEAALAGDRRADVEAHLAGCSSCRRDLRQMEETIAFLGRLRDEPEPVSTETMASLLAAFRESRSVL